MATQSLYRRYRPRRFSEVKGQEHVVRALRNAVINHREGQAYLFSGPRGTGKTTSARDPRQGAQLRAAGRRRAVLRVRFVPRRRAGHELRRARAGRGEQQRRRRDARPHREGRRSARRGATGCTSSTRCTCSRPAAEAALLKTLEEPPPHVVFVLATTDPQKVNDTIRSRTQHLQFHLLPMDVLEEHIRWLAADAGIDLDDAAVAARAAPGRRLGARHRVGAGARRRQRRRSSTSRRRSTSSSRR